MTQENDPRRPGGPGGPLRPGHRASKTYGDAPPSPPLVATLVATQVTSTSATLNGSVNPEGLAGSWWFVWGPTSSYGSTTASAAVSGSSPVTVNVGITGLVAGATYHFAVVCQTSAGLVYGLDVTFSSMSGTVVPVPVTQIVQGDATSPVAIPHFSWPFTVDSKGVRVVEQDSDGDVQSCVKTIASCFVGEWPENPNFGIPDLTFSQAPLNDGDLANTIMRWEPRASETVISQMVADGTQGSWITQITTEVSS